LDDTILAFHEPVMFPFFCSFYVFL